MDKRKYWIFSLAFTLSVIADQLTKVWARTTLKAGHRTITIVDGYFDFVYSENPGSAFGLLRDFEYGRYVLLIVGVFALGVIYSFLRKVRPERPRIAVWLGLLAGGAVGNIIDRLVYQKVTDFVLWHVRDLHWPVFNVADAALVVGVIALLVDARGDELSGAPAKKDPVKA